MKSLNKIFYIILLLMPIMASCINEDDSECVQYSVTAQAVDGKGNALSGSVMKGKEALLFINGLFEREVQAESDGRYLISFDGGEQATLAIFGNVLNDSVNIKEPKAGDSIENVSVMQNVAARTPNETASMPEYLLYGRFDYKPTNKGETAAVSLQLHNECARLHVVLKNMQSRFNDGNYTVKLEGFRNGVSFSGAVTGDSVSYEPKGAFNAQGDYVTEAINLLPTVPGEYVTVSIYKNGIPLLSVAKDENGNPVTLLAGDDKSMVIDVNAVKCFITVMPWDDNGQSTVFN